MKKIKGPKDQIPTFCFDPFADEDEGAAEGEGFYEDTGLAPIRALLVARGGDDLLRLAESLIAHCRENGDSTFCVTGYLWMTHDDEALPPSAFDYDLLPDWLKQIISMYRKTEATEMLDELDRLRRIIDAARSDKAARDRAHGSWEELRERLAAAADALKHYAEGGEGVDRARHVLAFISEDTQR